MYTVKRCYTSDDKLLSNSKQNSTLVKGSSNRPIASPTLLESWEVLKDGRITCPPKNVGGCGVNILDLRCVFSFGWTKELQLSIEEILEKHDFPETSDVGSSCSFCQNKSHNANITNRVQEAARRSNSSDNFLYYPTSRDLRTENIEHFQKHWAKGHPVIVRNSIQNAVNLSWDPVTMLCTYLGNSNANSGNDEEARKWAKCLDWCEVSLGFFSSLCKGAGV